jgi:LacI family transcriptional regulator
MPSNVVAYDLMSGRSDPGKIVLKTGLLNRFLVPIVIPMRRRRTTIRDVARAAGVSPTTVSRYLNKVLTLPSHTAEQIERARESLGYQPNRLAQRLSIGSSGLIGLATPEIANPFFASLAAASESEARLLGYSLLITSTNGDPEIESGNIDRLDARDVDGLIVLINRPDNGQICRRITGRRDVVLLDEDVPGADVARIFVENEQGARQATQFLIEAGHRRIAHVGGPLELFSAKERFRGFAYAMQEAGLSVDPSLVRFGEYHRDWGLEAIRSLAGFGAAPTAVFAGSDYIALGVLQGLHELGLEAPRDLSIVSFDDMPFAEFLHPPLTTVRQPIEEMGRLGVSTLLAQLRGEQIRGVARLPTELVVRGSVARAVLRRRRGENGLQRNVSASGRL